MRYEFANERNVDRNRERHLVYLRVAEYLTRELVFSECDVFRDIAMETLLRNENRFHLAGSWFDRYHHSRANQEGASVYFLAIDLDVAVGDELLRTKDRGGETESENNVVESAL